MASPRAPTHDQRNSARRAVRVRDGRGTLPARTGNGHALKLNSRTPHMPLRAAIEFERVIVGRSRRKRAKVAYA